MHKLNWPFFTTLVLLFAIQAVAAGEAIKAKLAQNVASPNQVSKLEMQLQPASKGESLLLLHNGIKQTQVELYKGRVQSSPQVRWHGEDLLEVQVGVMPQGKVTIFYDLIGQRQSPPIVNVLAFDRRGAIAANVDQERLRLVSVFALQAPGGYHGGNSLALEAKFPPGRPLLDVIKRAEFTPGGDFLMRYEVGEKVLMGVRVNANQIQFEPND